MAKKVKMEVVRELVSNPVEEWNEWRVYRGDVRLGSFENHEDAEAFVAAA